MTGNPIVARPRGMRHVAICYRCDQFFGLRRGPAFWQDACMAISQREQAMRKISIAVLLRLTAMDVCCGPPQL